MPGGGSCRDELRASGISAHGSRGPSTRYPPIKKRSHSPPNFVSTLHDTPADDWYCHRAVYVPAGGVNVNTMDTVCSAGAPVVVYVLAEPAAFIGSPFTSFAGPRLAPSDRQARTVSESAALFGPLTFVVAITNTGCADAA